MLGSIFQWPSWRELKRISMVVERLPLKPGEEKSGGSCSWILVTLNAEKLHQQPQQEADDGVMWRRSHELRRRTYETERIHMRLMNFVMLQELMKQLTNFKSSEAMWRSSVKLRGAEVQSPKTRDGITTNENGDHDYVEYNNSSTTSPCQDHSPWLSA
ncbi:hypothetical protein F2Q69_00049711 [Brassica cretica]|uniref:Uncharacterized protein n=1 Tax=Brassica cretica TaxID=69181 RepID=A0A8S9Q396_BRACR|nr:hypothetical protein F2Q69_00049711 [Brassica cretica]